MYFLLSQNLSKLNIIIKYFEMQCDMKYYDQCHFKSIVNYVEN